MKRLVIMTVGKTHSGKTTFARELEKQLPHSVVIDQDHHAEFINTYYQTLRPIEGPNTIKYAVTQTIVDYAVKKTNFHIILCNSNRNREGRLELINDFTEKGFVSILVHFDLPDYILQERIAISHRTKSIFRTATTFEEVLARQQIESNQGYVTDPIQGEANHLFVINNSDEVQSVIQRIVRLAQSI